MGLIPELRRSPGEGKGYPFQYSSLENPMDCIVHGHKESDTTKHESDKTQHEWTRQGPGDLERVGPAKSPTESGGKTDT